MALLCSVPLQVHAADAVEQPAGAWLVVRDDVVLAAGNAARKRPVASLVKLLTAIVWLAHTEDRGAETVISRAAAAARGARAGLREGERYRTSDLLTAMLVRSANDACTALAEAASGSVEGFVSAMSETTGTLGLANSQFMNPCGLDEPGQFSTANDMLKLAREAGTRPEIRAAGVLRQFTLVELDTGRRIELASTNHLLGRHAAVDGLKTGFTHEAGDCLIAHAARDGHEVWVVMLDARERWWTAHRWIDAAFAADG